MILSMSGVPYTLDKLILLLYPSLVAIMYILVPEWSGHFVTVNFYYNLLLDHQWSLISLGNGYKILQASGALASREWRTEMEDLQSNHCDWHVISDDIGLETLTRQILHCTWHQVINFISHVQNAHTVECTDLEDSMRVSHFQLVHKDMESFW